MSYGQVMVTYGQGDNFGTKIYASLRDVRRKRDQAGPGSRTQTQRQPERGSDTRPNIAGGDVGNLRVV
jgi:hypothetical protein